MHTTVAHLSVQTGMNELHKVITDIMEKIQNHNISFELDPGSFYLMMEEALVNAMHHGNRWNSGKTVNVSLQLDDFALYIIIADEGEGFSQLDLTAGNENSESKGIRIIRRFCNPYWNDKGNTIYLKLPLWEERIRHESSAGIDVHAEAARRISRNLSIQDQNRSYRSFDS